MNTPDNMGWSGSPEKTVIWPRGAIDSVSVELGHRAARAPVVRMGLAQARSVIVASEPPTDMSIWLMPPVTSNKNCVSSFGPDKLGLKFR